MAGYGPVRFEHVMQPISGKAVPVYTGEVLRISLLEGPQCVDFNCFNLHDYKEHMSQSWTRLLNPRPGKGSVILSRSPRYRPMLAILEKAESCVIDMIGPGCHGVIWEMRYGFQRHPSCQDTLAESIGEYGLTPDDVHDSYNMWYETAVSEEGFNPDAGLLKGSPGDFIDLLALMDVLAVPVVCAGSNLQAGSGNYWPKPIRLEVLEASEESKDIVRGYVRRMGGLVNQRDVSSFRVKEIRSTRSLTPVPGYEARFIDFPLERREFIIRLPEREYQQVVSLVEEGFATDEASAIRSAVLKWYNENRAQIPPVGRLYQWPSA